MIGPGVRDRPSLTIQPAVLYGVAVMAVLAVGSVDTLSVTIPRSGRIAAGVLAIASVALWCWGALTMRRARTAIFPVNPATAVVAEGPFALTRNPLYCALVASLIALVVGLGTIVGATLVLLYQWAMHQLVVLREEEYLRAKFGERYTQYCAKVRRWL